MGITIEESRVLQVAILSSLDDFCLKNNRKYYLGCGSLLGAVRHHGFIPWDDDIDVWMPRPDYDFLMHHYTHEYIRFGCMEKDEKWPLNFGKLYDDRTICVDEFGNQFGVYIDIFPIDGLPDSDREIKNHIRRIRLLQKLWSNSAITRFCRLTKANSIVKNIKILVGRLLAFFLPTKTVVSILSRALTKYAFDESALCCSITDSHFVLDKSKFENGIRVSFEDKFFLIPSDFDYFLKIWYGDYMKLPPESERKLKHGICAYWK